MILESVHAAVIDMRTLDVASSDGHLFQIKGKAFVNQKFHRRSCLVSQLVC